MLAMLKHAVLRNANLAGTVLAMADLSTADLRGALLLGADLRGACFERATLNGANLTNVIASPMALRSGDRLGVVARTSCSADVYLLHCDRLEVLSVYPEAGPVHFDGDRRVDLRIGHQLDVDLRFLLLRQRHARSQHAGRRQRHRRPFHDLPPWRHMVRREAAATRRDRGNCTGPAP